jgi:hypothetical protein
MQDEAFPAIHAAVTAARAELAATLAAMGASLDSRAAVDEELNATQRAQSTIATVRAAPRRTAPRTTPSVSRRSMRCCARRRACVRTQGTRAAQTLLAALNVLSRCLTRANFPLGVLAGRTPRSFDLLPPSRSGGGPRSSSSSSAVGARAKREGSIGPLIADSARCAGSAWPVALQELPATPGEIDR